MTAHSIVCIRGDVLILHISILKRMKQLHHAASRMSLLVVGMLLPVSYCKPATSQETASARSAWVATWGHYHG